MNGQTATEARPLREYLITQIGQAAYNNLHSEMAMSRHQFEHWLTRAPYMTATHLAALCRATGLAASDLMTDCHAGRNRLTIGEAEALTIQYPAK